MTKPTYKVIYNRRYLKDLEKIPFRMRKLISESVEELAFDPRPQGYKKLQGSSKIPLFRVRCGEYRIIYTIEDDKLLVLIIEIGHRREIYQ